MKLYPKRLNNVAELKREKKLLKEEQKNADLHHLFSTGGAGEDAEESEPAAGSLMGMALSLLGSESLLGAAMKHGPSLFRLFSKKKARQEYAPPPTEDDKQPSFIMKAIKEVGFGYLKWKAIELSFKGIKKLINARKHKEA